MGPFLSQGSFFPNDFNLYHIDIKLASTLCKRMGNLVILECYIWGHSIQIQHLLTSKSESII